MNVTERLNKIEEALLLQEDFLNPERQQFVHLSDAELNSLIKVAIEKDFKENEVKTIQDAEAYYKQLLNQGEISIADMRVHIASAYDYFAGTYD